MDSFILDGGNDLRCQFCNGTLNKMGILGNREHYNCQQCGMESSVDLTRIKINKAEKADNNILYYTDMEDDSLI